jgi:DNA-binding MarR family transcriptional regulator
MHRRHVEPAEMSVGQLLAQVCRMTGHHLRKHMERLGLHRGQGFALFHLWHHDGLPQREIARAMHIRPASVTNMLQRMERDGWIERRRDEADQRIVRVFVTKKADALRKEAESVFLEMENELNEVYTKVEQTTLRNLLLKLHDHFAPEDPGDAHHPSFFPPGHREEDA